MGMQLMALLLAAVPAAGGDLQAGVELTYRGAFTAEKGEVAATRKSFDLTLLVARADSDGAVLYWILEERGHGAWPWPHRFGRFEVDAQGALRAGEKPTLLYVREQGTSEAAITPPFLAAGKPLAKGLKWEQGRLQHHVVEQEKTGDTSLWKVEIRDPYGIRRVARIDSASGRVRSQAERVFIGQGEQFELTCELLSEKTASGDELKSTLTALDRLAALRERLDAGERNANVKWSDEQIALLQSEIPKIGETAPGGAIGRLLEDAGNDARRQLGEAGAVAAMRKKIVGQKLPEFTLEGLAGDELNAAALNGKVTVLHFWDYRDTPLEEPYGQVAYLDYLYRQRASNDVQICGVVADPRLEDPQTRAAALRGAKKLASFMNLSYPVYVDDGLLKQIGDPRVAGATLPLFVLIGRSGEVIEYHAGFYEVTRERGLAALENAVNAALKAEK